MAEERGEIRLHVVRPGCTDPLRRPARLGDDELVHLLVVYPSATFADLDVKRPAVFKPLTRTQRADSGKSCAVAVVERHRALPEEREEKLRERKKHHESEGYFRRKRYVCKLEPDHPGKACHHSGKNNRQQPPNAAQNDGYPPFYVSRNGHSPRRPPSEQHEVAALDPRFFGGNLVRTLSRGLWRARRYGDFLRGLAEGVDDVAIGRIVYHAWPVKIEPCLHDKAIGSVGSALAPVAHYFIGADFTLHGKRKLLREAETSDAGEPRSSLAPEGEDRPPENHQQNYAGDKYLGDEKHQRGKDQLEAERLCENVDDNHIAAERPEGEPEHQEYTGRAPMTECDANKRLSVLRPALDLNPVACRNLFHLFNIFRSTLYHIPRQMRRAGSRQSSNPRVWPHWWGESGGVKIILHPSVLWKLSEIFRTAIFITTQLYHSKT